MKDYSNTTVHQLCARAHPYWRSLLGQDERGGSLDFCLRVIPSFWSISEVEGWFSYRQRNIWASETFFSGFWSTHGDHALWNLKHDKQALPVQIHNQLTNLTAYLSKYSLKFSFIPFNSLEVKTPTHRNARSISCLPLPLVATRDWKMIQWFNKCSLQKAHTFRYFTAAKSGQRLKSTMTHWTAAVGWGHAREVD